MHQRTVLVVRQPKLLWGLGDLASVASLDPLLC